MRFLAKILNVILLIIGTPFMTIGISILFLAEYIGYFIHPKQPPVPTRIVQEPVKKEHNWKLIKPYSKAHDYPIRIHNMEIALNGYCCHCRTNENQFDTSI